MRIVVATILLSGVCSVGAVVSPSEGATATGIAHFTFDDGTLRTTSFDASSRRDNSVVGHIDIQDRVPIPDQNVDGTGDPALVGSPTGVNLNAEVDCLVIDGTTAIVEVTGGNVKVRP